MINSLSKGSHITQNCRFQESAYCSEKSASKNVSNNLTVNNSDIIVKNPAEISFSGFSNVKNPGFNVYKNGYIKKFLELADKNQILFSAGFALILTALLRPATIMALPSDKKNKDDKKYASAHSIASGVIGFAVSIVVSTPISDGIKKAINNQKLYLKKKHYPINGTDEKIASNYLNKLPDILIAVPKGIITVALIPVILKYVFGWEKKKFKNGKIEVMTQDFSILNFKSSDSIKKRTFSDFKGGEK